MVVVGSCIASKLLSFLGGGNGMLQSPGCPLVVSIVTLGRVKGDSLVAARSSGLPVGGAKYSPD